MVHTIDMKSAKIGRESTFSRKAIWIKYLAFCDSYKANPLIWYLIPLMVFSAVVTPIVCTLLYLLNLPYVWVMSLSVLLFYTNIIANIMGYNTRVTISVFFITTIIMVLIPFISYIVLA